VQPPFIARGAHRDDPADRRRAPHPGVPIWSGGPANRTMTTHKVVLVRFPFDDLSSTKVRPAVCLTEPIGPHQHLIVAFVSSRIPASPLPTDLLIDSRDAGFAAGRAAGLIHASTASLDDGHQSVAST